MDSHEIPLARSQEFEDVRGLRFLRGRAEDGSALGVIEIVMAIRDGYT
jgi:hypothetical protein